MSEWYYNSDGREFGPISGQELKRLADTGRLRSTDVVRKAGDSKPRPASSVPRLFPEPPSGDIPRTPREPKGITLAGFIGFLCALVSISLGGGGAFLLWKNDYKSFVMPVALLGLSFANAVLLWDWLRGRLRLSLAHLAVTLNTVTLLVGFVDAGGFAKTVTDLRQASHTQAGSDPINPSIVAVNHDEDTSAKTPKSRPTELPGGDSSRAPKPTQAPTDPNKGMTKDEPIARIEALGNPCAREDLFKTVGKPHTTETRDGQLAGLVWTWKCRDGTVEVVLLNPDFGTGEHTDKKMAYVSKINDN